MPGGHDQTLRPFLWRATRLYPDTEIVSREHDGLRRYTYGEYADRTAQLANALDEYGIEAGDRVATFCWNHARHFETYFGVPTIGAQLHTINPLLPDEHVRYIVDNADDELVFVDPSLAGKLAAAAADAEEFDGVDFVVMGSEPVDDLDATPTRSSSRATTPTTIGPSWTATSPRGSVTPRGRPGGRRASSTRSRCCGATRWRR